MKELQKFNDYAANNSWLIFTYFNIATYKWCFLVAQSLEKVIYTVSYLQQGQFMKLF